MSRFRIILIGILVLLLLVAGVGGWYIWFHDRGLNCDFDPRRVAESETLMWQHYYAGRPKDMALEMVRLMREQMGVSLRTAIAVVKPMAHGAMAFQKSGGDAYGHIHSRLTDSYARLAEACGKDWNARELAEAELAWWIARRDPNNNAPEQVGAKIAHLYSLLYGETNPQIERAGLLRAQAAALRDAGGANADWATVQSLLVDSYTALRDGIQANCK